MLIVAIRAMATLGVLIAALPGHAAQGGARAQRPAPHLDAGTVLRERVRLFFPQGANPKPFPELLPTRLGRSAASICGRQRDLSRLGSPSSSGSIS